MQWAKKDIISLHGRHAFARAVRQFVHLLVLPQEYQYVGCDFPKALHLMRTDWATLRLL